MKKEKQKNIMLDEELSKQIECLCKVLHTNFSNKTKSLLVEWKINELKRLENDSPEMFEQYKEEIKKAP